MLMQEERDGEGEVLYECAPNTARASKAPNRPYYQYSTSEITTAPPSATYRNPANRWQSPKESPDLRAVFLDD